MFLPPSRMKLHTVAAKFRATTRWPPALKKTSFATNVFMLSVHASHLCRTIDIYFIVVTQIV